MYFDTISRAEYSALHLDNRGKRLEQGKEETPDLKSKFKDLILKINRLKIQEPEEGNLDVENFNNGIIHARNLLISEVKNIICPVCSKRKIEDKEDPVYLQD